MKPETVDVPVDDAFAMSELDRLTNLWHQS